MVFLGVQLLNEVMLYFVFTFVYILLYDVPRICAFHCVISHSGASLPSAWSSRVTVRGLVGVFENISSVFDGILAHVTGKLLEVGDFRGRPGSRRTLTSPSAPMS